MLTLRYSGPGRATAPVALVGLACRPAELRRARGRIAVAARGRCPFRTKARNAEAAGASGLVVADPRSALPSGGSLIRPGLEIPAVSAGAGALKLTGRARLVVNTVAENRHTRNVIAEQPGRPRRVAMVGAHLDSVREGPGINDNGSGVAVTLALAERLRNQRGLRFGFWGAEELGLYGSRRYVASLSAAERRRITGYLNLDMLGSPNAVRYLYGAGRVRDCARQGAARAQAPLRDDQHRRELRPRAVRRRGHLRRRAVLGLRGAQDRARGARVRRPRRPAARPLLPPALRCAQPGRPRRHDRARRGRRPGAAGALRVTPEARRRRLALVVAAALALVVGVAVGAGHDDPKPRSTAPTRDARPRRRRR